VDSDFATLRTPMHPGWLRCSSVAYHRDTKSPEDFVKRLAETYRVKDAVWAMAMTADDGLLCKMTLDEDLRRELEDYNRDARGYLRLHPRPSLFD
jgi:hypothetical protein